MANKATLATLTETIPPDILDILGSPPLLATEDPSDYHAMIAQLVDAIRPQDVITWMLVKDLVDHRFEVARYRRMKADVMRNVDRQLFEEQVARLRARHYNAVETLRAKADAEERAIPTGCDEDRRRADIRVEQAKSLRKRERDHRKAIMNLRQSRCTLDLAGRFESWAPQHERLDVLLGAAERRFRTTLADLERHLHGFALSLPGHPDKVIDVEPVGDDGAQAQGRLLAQH